jgi:hypothetical protein
LSHAFPDNLRVLLESPAGTSVILMANAGGATDVAAGTQMRFTSNAATPVPNGGPIVSGVFSPGSAYPDSLALGAPAPQPPYATSFDAFEGQPARGTWRLWIYDDSVGSAGNFEDATLTISTERGQDLTFLSPGPSAGIYNSDQPFVRLEAQISNSVDPFAYYWRVSANDEFYDAGPYIRIPGTERIYADVPLRNGTNTIGTTVTSSAPTGWIYGHTVNVHEFSYALAEGATGGFFDFDLTMSNPSGDNAPVTIDFLPEGAPPVPHMTTVNANRPNQISVDSIVPAAAVSAIVHSTDAVPLAVERTMIWDSRGYGGHGGTAVSPNTHWLFAEGSQGFFSTYILLANDNASAVTAHLTFLLEGGGTVPYPVNIDPHSRRTIYAGDIPALVNQSFGLDISATQAIIAERAMYLPGNRLFEGGHESAGVNESSTHWFLAEGATGPFFDCFILLSNPHGTDAHVTLTYLLPDGTTIPQAAVIPANGRLTINVELVHPLLANAAVSTTIQSDIGIVAERAMYWPGIEQGWQEAHNSFGVTAPALRWGLADIRVGGPRNFATYVLLANPNAVPAEVVVRFLRPVGGALTRTYTLAPTSRFQIWVNEELPELGIGVFGAEVQVSNFQPIVVEKALYWDSEGLVWAGGTNVTATPLPPR